MLTLATTYYNGSSHLNAMGIATINGNAVTVTSASALARDPTKGHGDGHNSRSKSYTS